MWGYNRVAEPLAQTQAWIFDPDEPDKLFEIETMLFSSIFCGGMTWDEQGQLVIAGGKTATPTPPCPDQYPPVEAYRFLPAALSPSPLYPTPCPFPPPPTCLWACESPIISGNPWVQTGSMSKPRYYPSLITLVRNTILGPNSPVDDIQGGAAFVIGGGPNECDELHPNDCDGQPEPLHGTSWWQPLEPGESQWARTYHPADDPTEPVAPPSHGQPYLRQPVGGNESLRPEPTIDSYPRVYQLASTEQSFSNLFVAYDIDSFTLGKTSCGNDPGDAWVIKLPYTSPPPPDLHKGPSAQDPNTGYCNDRWMGASALLHQITPSVQLNRVLVFGGSQFVPCGLPGQLEINRTVQEFAPGLDPVNGQWHTKNNVNATDGLITPRRYNSAVVLPTGRILIIGGETPCDPACTQQTSPCNTGCAPCSGQPPEVRVPEHRPELYDPGALPTSSGSSTLMVCAPIAPGSSRPFPRMYHNFALLLPDGRVFNAGGDPIEADPNYADSRFSGEIFNPPYLFQGFRPTIVGTSTDEWTLGGADVEVGVQSSAGETIVNFALLRPAAITHNFDADQRYIELSSSHAGSIRYLVTPPTEDLGPPGYYMLFAIGEMGGIRVPSVARFIRLQ